MMSVAEAQLLLYSAERLHFGDLGLIQARDIISDYLQAKKAFLTLRDLGLSLPFTWSHIESEGDFMVMSAAEIQRCREDLQERVRQLG